MKHSFLVLHYFLFFPFRDKVLNGDSNGACSEASNILLLTIINPLHPITVVSTGDGLCMSAFKPKRISDYWPLASYATVQ